MAASLPLIVLLLLVLVQLAEPCPSQCECDNSSVMCDKIELDSGGFEQLLRALPTTTTALNIRGLDSRCRLRLSENLNHFTSLRLLRVSRCQVPSIGRFLDLPELVVLDLSNNNIDVIPANTFSGLRRLNNLDLFGNRLSRLSTGAFRHLKNLVSLSLSYNNISFLATNLFEGLEQLQELHLDGNAFPSTQITSIFRELRGLRRLELSNCQLQSLELVGFHQAQALTRLGLAFNHLGFPIQELSSLRNLTSLDLSANAITELPDCAFCPLKSLSSINLARNALQTLPMNAFAETMISSIDLSYNAFPFFNSSMLGDARSSLRKFAFSGNAIADFLPELTSNLPQLTHLHLADNRLRFIPLNLPSEYGALQLLNISGNEIDELPENAADQLSSLRVLDISHNRFSSFPTGLISGFLDRLELVLLNDNPLDCSCSSGALRDLLRRRAAPADGVRCAHPDWLQGQALLAVDRRDDCAMLLGLGLSQSSELALILAVVIALGAVLGLLLLVAYFATERQHHGSYVTRETSCTPLTEAAYCSETLRLPLTEPPPPPPAVIYARY